jgi:glycosyltransferase involved in cell wall biosynthesis
VHFQVKVCVISSSFPPIKCGNSEGTIKLCNSIANNNISVHLITSTISNTDNNIEINDNVKVYKVINNWHLTNWRKLLYYVDLVKPDILHVEYPGVPYGHSIMINLFPLLLKSLRKPYPIVLRLHEFSKARILRKISIIPFILGCDKIAVPTEIELNYISKYLYPFSGKSLYVPIGNNIDVIEISDVERQNTRQKLGIAPDCTLLGYFGFISRTKDIETLLYSFKQSLALGLNAKLLMIAEPILYDISCGKRILHMIDSLQLTEKVIWSGRLDEKDVSIHLSATDAMILLYKDGVSTRRGSFMAAIEHGLPVITSRGLTVPEGLIHGQNVIFVHNYSVDDTAKAIYDLCMSPSTMNFIGNNASIYAKRYSWEFIGREFAGIYASLL